MASTIIGALRVALGLDSAQFERGLKRSQSDLRGFDRLGNTVSKSVGAAFGRLAGQLAAVFAVRGLAQFSDAATRITNSLKVAGLAGDELTRVYDRLFASAQRNAAPLEALTDLYGRASLVQKELGVSSEELLNFTDKVALALRVSGRSAAESSGALLQLSQALGSGVVRAEEFNSVLEGALPIAQAAAAGLEEAGGSVAKLRQLVVDGKVSSSDFFKAFEAGSAILETKVAGAQRTVAQGFQGLQNVLIDLVGRINASSGATDTLVGALDSLSATLASPGFRQAVATFVESMAKILGAIAKVTEGLGILADTMQDTASRHLIRPLQNELVGLENQMAPLKATIADLQAQLAETDPASGWAATLKAELADTQKRYEGFMSRALEIQERIAQLQGKPAGSSSGARPDAGVLWPGWVGGGGGGKPIKLSPVPGSGDAAAAKLLKQQLDELNKTLDAQRAGWESLMAPIRETFETIGDGVSGALSGLVSNSLRGQDAIGGLIDSVGQLGDELIKVASNQLIQNLLKSLLGSVTGGLTGGFGVGRGLTGAATYGFSGNGFFGIPSFEGGGFTGSGSRAGGLDGAGGFLAMLHPNETVSDGAGGGMSVSVSVDARGAQQGAGAEIANAVSRVLRQQLPDAIAAYNRNPWRRA